MLLRHACLLLVVATGCGLDDFAWGGPKDLICAVEWQMRVSGPAGIEDVRPRIEDVIPGPPGDIAWKARYADVSQSLRIRDMRFGEQPVYLYVDGDQVFAVRVEGPCAYTLSNSDLREEKLRRYTCQLQGEHQHVLLQGELVLEEVDHCE